MKRALIISYHALPMDAIASYRANAYLKHFPKFGITPTLVTHNWANPENKSVQKEKTAEGGTIIRLPLREQLSSKHWYGLNQFPVLNKLQIVVRWVFGMLDPYQKDHDSYLSFRFFLFEYLKANQFDLLLGIFSPHHHLRLCYELHKIYGIPYVLDFRDLWNNRIIHNAYKPDIVERIQDNITRYYWSKWLSKANFFTITSESWRGKVNEFSRISGYVLHNGYEKEAFETITLEQKTDEFIILHAGSLYEHQQLEIFIEGCKQFIKNVDPSSFKLKFIGADRRHGNKKISGFMYEPKKQLLKNFSTEYCEVTKRIPKTELIKEFEKSQLLLFPSFPNSPGTYAGKIFDYLGAKRNILVVPDDYSVVGALIRETKAGHIANTPEEVSIYLMEEYSIWLKKGKIPYHGKVEEIKKYTREAQVQKMAEYINTCPLEN